MTVVNQDGYAEPEPVHTRDTAGYHDHRRALVLERDLRAERRARAVAEEELERARRLVGGGPFLLIRLDSLNALTDSGQFQARLVGGGGVTPHMFAAVLSLAEEALRGAHGQQEETVRLPEVTRD